MPKPISRAVETLRRPGPRRLLIAALLFLAAAAFSAATSRAIPTEDFASIDDVPTARPSEGSVN